MGLRRSARSHLPKIIPAPFYFDVETVRQHTNTYSECVYPGSAGGGVDWEATADFQKWRIAFWKRKDTPQGGSIYQTKLYSFFCA